MIWKGIGYNDAKIEDKLNTRWTQNVLAELTQLELRNSICQVAYTVATSGRFRSLYVPSRRCVLDGDAFSALHKDHHKPYNSAGRNCRGFLCVEPFIIEEL